MKRPVLIVEDNEDLLDDLLLNLHHQKINALGAIDAQAMDVLFAKHQPEIVVLDISLPGENGLSIAKRLKKSHPAMGIIMLTARSAIQDRLLGLKLGADHYLTKPVNYQELAAIILALHRRLSLGRVVTTESAWVVCKQKMTIQSPLGASHSVTLTGTELSLLEVFAKTFDGLATKEDLIVGLGGVPEYFDVRRLETSISRLRRKLCALYSPHPEGVELIRSVRAVGYQFTQVLKIKAE